MNQQRFVSALRELLPLSDNELEQVILYARGLNDAEAAQHLENLLGNSPKSIDFISSFLDSQTVDDGAQSIQATTSDPDSKKMRHDTEAHPPPYATISGSQTVRGINQYAIAHHTNDLIEASKIRAQDEEHRIYNSEIEPEHDTGYPCDCSIHQYKLKKWVRLGIQERWAKAVMYPGERFYSDCVTGLLFVTNQYQLGVGSPYGSQTTTYSRGPTARLNREAQAKVDAMEPEPYLWDQPELSSSMAGLTLGDHKSTESDRQSIQEQDAKYLEIGSDPQANTKPKATSRLANFRKAIGVRSTEERKNEKSSVLRVGILKEELGRWPDSQWRQLVTEYQERIGISTKVADLRTNCPIQYLHLLRGGYFEPIPVQWATHPSNPLKFRIEAASGWRGITPSWRGFDDLAEERLYWVLNHRKGSSGTRMKPDFISTMNMANERMARAVEPPPIYSSADDICNLQHTSGGYSKQVMQAPFEQYDRPELPTDDTMILLDVSDVARSIIRRFTEAISHGDQHHVDGYDLVTFANEAEYMGTINQRNFDEVWRNITFGGRTRVMAGWQQVKELHFQKHSQSAYYHPVYGWKAGPETPMLRLLLLLDGEAVDMDEFELDLLSLNWAHVTIFLIGVDGCPHHHRHANELQRISDVNRHVSFIDAQGNIPERYVTHELLKRHLGYDLSMDEFKRMEGLPSYSEI
uniref:VWFA domain-containing protein n=1 Tax=Talaromyces marneffei PM1 TaxID=1077442 RepID=A0A093V2L5_TALMA